MKNPPAFPNSYRARTDYGRGELKDMHHHGMSLRQYYVGQAIAGLCAHPTWLLTAAQAAGPAEALRAIGDAACEIAGSAMAALEVSP